MISDEKLAKKTENLEHMVKFFLFSISAGVIQALSFTLFFEVLFKDRYWVSYLIALTLSVLWNFTLNRKFTFKSAANVPLAMSKVAFYYLLFTPASTWWGETLTNLNWHPYLVLFLTMVTNLVTEFIFTKYVVYHNQINTAVKKKEEEILSE